MTTYDVDFADPERAIIDRLKATMTETVSTWFPKSSTELPPAVPFVQVGWDGTPADHYPVLESATIRVTYWAAVGAYTAAKAGAAVARGHLLAHPGDAAIWRVRPGVGRLPGIDPETRLPFCTFTVLVDTRPIAAA